MTPNAEIVIAWLDVDGPLSMDTLSAEERARAERFFFAHHRRRFIAGRTMLRRLLATRLGQAPEAIRITTGSNGRPALAGGALEFNLSHSRDLAVYAFSRSPVGVDVEFVRTIPEADSVASHVFSTAELATYRALREIDRPSAFFNCWTRKEAFVKALGTGLTHPLHDFDVSFAPGDPARIARIGDLPGESCGWRVESFTPAPGFIAALATQRA